jgi:hypothetical protein
MSYVDISGLLNIQKNYLVNLDTSSNNPNGVTSQLTSINAGLNQISDALGNNSAAYVLTGQNTVKDILNREQQRLEAKKQSVDNAIYGEKRLVDLNNSYMKKNWEWNKIGLILCLCFFLILFFIYFHKYTNVPNFIINIIFITILSICIIWCLYIYYYGIYIRDNIYFDELSTTAPLMANPKKSTTEITNDVTSTGTGMSFNGLCIGQNCCNAPLNYNTNLSKCVSACTDAKPFWDTTINNCVVSCPKNTVQSGKSCVMAAVSAFTTMNEINQPMAFYKNEYDDYDKYK